MKGDPQDIRDLAEDLQGALQRHADAVRHNPDIATEIVKIRDRTFKRYEEVSEKRPKE